MNTEQEINSIGRDRREIVDIELKEESDTSVVTEVRPLCSRLLCIWRPGTPIEGKYCSGYYTGKSPNTGRYACHTCGKTMNRGML